MEHQDHPLQHDDYDDDLGASHHNWDQPQEHLAFPVGNHESGVDQHSPPAVEARGSTSSLNPEAPEFQWQKYSTNEGIALDLSGSQSSWGNTERQQGLDWTQYDEEMSGQPSMMYWGQSSPLAQGHHEEEQVISPIEDLENPFTLEEHARQQLSYNAQLGQVFAEHHEHQQTSNEYPSRTVEPVDLLKNEVVEQQQLVQDFEDNPQAVADESLSNIEFEAQGQNFGPNIENALFEPVIVDREATAPSTEDAEPVDHPADVLTASQDLSQTMELAQTSPFLSESINQQNALDEQQVSEVVHLLESPLSQSEETFEPHLDAPAVEQDQTGHPLEEGYHVETQLDAPEHPAIQSKLEEERNNEPAVFVEELVQETQVLLQSETQVLQDALGFSTAADDKITNGEQLLSPQNEITGQLEQMEEPVRETELAVTDTFHEEYSPNSSNVPGDTAEEELGNMAAPEAVLQEADFTHENRLLANETVLLNETTIATTTAADVTEETTQQTSSDELHTSPLIPENVSTPGDQFLAPSSSGQDYMDEVKEETIAESLLEDLCQPAAGVAPTHEVYGTAATEEFNQVASVEEDVLVAEKEVEAVAAVEASGVADDEAFQADDEVSLLAPESHVTEVNGNTIESVEVALNEVESSSWTNHRGVDNVADDLACLDETAVPVEETQALTTPAGICDASKCSVDQLISPMNDLILEESPTPAAAVSDAHEHGDLSEKQSPERHVSNVDEALDSLEPVVEPFVEPEVKQMSALSAVEEQGQSPEEVSIPSNVEEQELSSEELLVSSAEEQVVEPQNEVTPEAVSEEGAKVDDAPEKQPDVPEDSQPSESAVAAVAGGVAAAVASGVAAAVTAAGASKPPAKKPAAKRPLGTATSPTKPKPSPAAKEAPKKAEIKPARPTRLSPLRKATPAAAPKSVSKPTQPTAASSSSTTAAASAAPKKPVSATTRPAAPLVKKTAPTPAPTTSAPKTSPSKTALPKPAASATGPKKPTSATAATATRPTSTRPAAPKPVANGDVKKTPTPTSPRVATRPATTGATAAATRKPLSAAATKVDPAKTATASKPLPSAAAKSTRPALTKPPASRPAPSAAAPSSSSAKPRTTAGSAGAAPVVKRNAALSPKSGAGK